MLTIDPHGFTAREWTDYMGSELESFGQLPILHTDHEWREWASAVMLLPKLAAINPPDPYAFDDWRDWATRFNQLISPIT